MSWPAEQQNPSERNGPPYSEAMGIKSTRHISLVYGGTCVFTYGSVRVNGMEEVGISATVAVVTVRGLLHRIGVLCESRLDSIPLA
jgi:hypothetical protein